MNRLIIAVLLWLPMFAMAQTPNYFANSPTWVCGLEDNFPHFHIDSYVYYLDGDTTIQGQVYHRLNKRGFLHDLSMNITDTIDTRGAAYLRQEGRSIRYFDKWSGTDSLLVSYETSVGDTVRGYIFEDCGYGDTTVQFVDSILIGSDYRRVLYIDTAFGTRVIEGVGHLIYEWGPIGEFIEPLCLGLGFDHVIECYGQNGVPLWDPYGNGGSCALNVSVEEVQKSEIRVYPNPVSDRLFIESSERIDGLKLYTVDGKNVYHEFNTSMSMLSVDGLDSGIYLLVISVDSGRRRVKRLIVK